MSMPTRPATAPSPLAPLGHAALTRTTSGEPAPAQVPAPAPTRVPAPRDHLTAQSSSERTRGRADRPARPRWCRYLSDLTAAFVNEFLELYVGSPRQVLRMLRAFFVLALVSLVASISEAVFFVRMTADVCTRWQKAYMLVLIVAPMFVTAATLPKLAHVLRRMHLFLELFENHVVQISDLLVAQFHRREAKYVKAYATFLSLWYIACLLVEAGAPPCVQFQKIDSWRYGVAALPCELFGFWSTAKCALNVAMASTFALMPRAMCRLRRFFTPGMGTGLPKVLLDYLPTRARSERDEEDDDANGRDKTCSICLEEFEVGQVVRQLPCGHVFHATCSEGWLIKRSTCPMRCHHNLWEAIRREQRAAGVAPPEMVPADLIEEVTAAVAARRGLSQASSRISPTNSEAASQGAPEERHQDAVPVTVELEEQPLTLPADDSRSDATIGEALACEVEVVAVTPPVTPPFTPPGTPPVTPPFTPRGTPRRETAEVAPEGLGGTDSHGPINHQMLCSRPLIPVGSSRKRSSWAEELAALREDMTPVKAVVDADEDNGASSRFVPAAVPHTTIGRITLADRRPV